MIGQFIVLERAGIHSQDLFIIRDSDGKIRRGYQNTFLEEMCRPHSEPYQFRIVKYTEGIAKLTPDAPDDVKFFCCHTFMNAPDGVFGRTTLLTVFNLLWEIIDKE